jgi:hypothetical protein
MLRCAVTCRVDVLLKADQPSDRTYWISVGSQYRKGAPSGYGVIKYSGGSSSGPDPATIVTPAAVVDKKWTTDGASCLPARLPAWFVLGTLLCCASATVASNIVSSLGMWHVKRLQCHGTLTSLCAVCLLAAAFF